jgi:hypothetical protein
VPAALFRAVTSQVGPQLVGGTTGGQLQLTAATVMAISWNGSENAGGAAMEPVFHRNGDHVSWDLR